MHMVALAGDVFIYFTVFDFYFIFIALALYNVSVFIDRKPDVPPNATINYEIEILNCEDAPDISKLSLDERIRLRL